MAPAHDALPEDDKHTYTRGYLEAMLAVLMGDVPRKKYSSATSPPARATTSNAPRISRATWFANGV